MLRSTKFVLFLALLIASQAAYAGPWKVGAEGNTSGAALRTALFEAEAGDTIHIYPGRYSDIGYVVSKPLVILGIQGPEVTILDGGESNFAFWVSKAGTGSHIEGLTFLDCRTKKFGAAISLINGGELTVRNNIFRGCRSQIGGAVYSGPNGNPVIENNLFVDNISSSWGGALYAQLGAPVLRNNTFVRNNAEFDGSALAFHDAFPKVSHNLFAGNLGISSVFVKTPRCQAEFNCNAFWKEAGKSFGLGEGVEAQNDPAMQTADPMFADALSYNLSENSPYGRSGRCGSVGWR